MNEGKSKQEIASTTERTPLATFFKAMPKELVPLGTPITKK